MEAFQYISFGDTNLASGLKSLSSSAKRVESLGSITSLFQTNSRVKYETIVNLLDTQDFAGLDVSAFKLCLSNCQDEAGLISQYNWLQLISNLYEDRKQAVDEGSLNLDTGGVNWISNLVGSVIAGVFSAVGAILLAVGGVIVKVIGLVVTAIGFVVQKITDFITNEAVHTRPYVKDPYSSTSYVDGPLVKNIGMYALNLPNEYSRQAGLIQTGPMDYYMFRGVDGKLNCNAFLDLSVNVGAAFSYLRGRLSPTFTGTTPYRIVTTVRDGAGRSSWRLPNNCYKTQEEIINLKVADDYTITWNIIGHIIIHGLLCLDNTVENKFYENSTIWIPTDFTGTAENRYKAQVFPLEMALKALFYTNVDDFINWYLSYDSQLKCLDNYFFNAYYGFEKEWDENLDEYDRSCVTPINITYLTQINYTFYTCPYGLTYTPRNGYSFDALTADDYVDFLPNDRAFSINNTTLEEIIKAVAVTTLIIAGVTIVAAVAAKKIKNAKFKSKLKWTEKLSQAKTDYMDNPTSETYRAYKKTQKGYNLRAKLFGWPAYDPVNDWFDDGGTTEESMYDLDDIQEILVGN